MYLKTALFDLDDTLIECGIYYREALRKGGEFIAKRTGMSVDRATSLISDMDLYAVSIDPNFRRDRFPRSFYAASIAADLLANNWPDYAASGDAYSIGDSVFAAAYALREGAIGTLGTLLSEGYRLVLVTKGDRVVQQSKIDRHHLDDYFSSIHIVQSKGTEQLGEILEAERVDITRSVMVGDSLKDDIAPAIANGLRAIHIAPTDHWSYNNADVIPTARIEELPELFAVLEGIDSREREAAVPT